ncbi:mannitol dehydrogenase family protein [Thalassococcus sp. S3]|uniref:mannitol dehydrogenase family protein n=1 Tax=Thalassococcus sp. S3 TaxID=2017482 RepID=UPI0020C59300|nr:mannitol dehydrogenase family protein [Thalassococcus sp. S3]
MCDARPSPKVPLPLRDATLGHLPDHVLGLSYDRAVLSPGIVHIGLGNFHRAHQAWYIHRLMQQGLAQDWAILGAGIRAGDADQRTRLLQQDCLTTLIELAPTGRTAEICGSMIGFLPVESGNQALIAQMADPGTRIVSLTITEGGYFTDPATGGFDASHPDVLHDIEHPDAPRTAFGAMVAALRLRRMRGAGPFTGMSCDNLQGNGAILRRAVVTLARLTDPDLADWIDASCSFPNSMVDCIVPATSAAEIALARDLGIEDAAPVTHEDFRQWVIEDTFCAGRPDLARVGVTLSDRVHDYELQKIRILNGGHQVIANAGDLLGIKTIDGAMDHPLIGALLRKVVLQEIAPHVPSVPSSTAQQYFDLIERRFRNAAIGDTTRRVAFDGSSRHPGFIVPSIRDGLARDMSVDGLALVSAIWARYCQGHRDDGSVIAANDPNWTMLQTQARAAMTDPIRWIEMQQFYGDLANNALFAERFIRWFKEISDTGIESAIQNYLSR